MRLCLFLLALAVTFGAAVAAGSAFGPEPAETASVSGAMRMPAERAAATTSRGDHAHQGPAGDERPTTTRGLAAADGGLRLVVATPELRRGRPQTLRFRVLDAHDRSVRSFDVTHERRMHAIVVRRDLSGFRHVHPRMADDGTWSVPLRLDEPGSYRLYADFARDGDARTLASNLRVDGAADLRPLPPPAAATVSDGGETVRLDAGRPRAGRDAQLRFAVERDDRPFALDPYLGAGGHLVALREGDLAFLHVHPLASRTTGDDVEDHGRDADPHAAPDGRVAFAATFPSAGLHRLFLQYRVGNSVRTAAFTVAVTP